MGKEPICILLYRGVDPALPTGRTELVFVRISYCSSRFKIPNYKILSIRHQICSNINGAGAPFAGCIMPRLEYITKGVKRADSEKPSTGTRTRLPITSSILLRLKEVWEKSPVTEDTLMIWAACTLAFFGFLRIGEMTVHKLQSYDPTVHLSIPDVVFDHPSTPTAMFVTIKSSKTDPFRKGVTLALGRTNRPLCPVAAMAAYLQQRGHSLGPLFCFKNGEPLTRKKVYRSH